MSDLQFDKAEFEKAPAAVTCAFCRQPIHGVYYQVGDKLTCERCRSELEVALAQGSGPARFFRAALYGIGAGALGAGLWYGVRAITNYEIGFIAILVGFLVGAAVRKGSNGRGGWLYQALAVFLTYTSIVSTYVPYLLRGRAEDANGTQLVAAFAIAFAAPFLAGFQNLIGIFIIAIGLYEAWKINRRMPIEITGPFRVSSAGP